MTNNLLNNRTSFILLFFWLQKENIWIKKGRDMQHLWKTRPSIITAWSWSWSWSWRSRLHTVAFACLCLLDTWFMYDYTG
ncbi:hypothetical protein VNO78_28534 [Psophocarpus tetragonolobus]|uniref:Uncharacterized protein n=1 Tax=Psophocarpus tetragonolobus TaxID=3891 RepID=A0AAN9XBT8_PSOTE